MMLQLMMGQFERRTETLDLLGGSSTTFKTLELEPEKPLPCGWEKCLDLKTGTVYYMNSSSGRKVLNDPRDSLPSFSIKQPRAEPTKCSSEESLLHNDSCTTKELPASRVGFIPLRSRECVPEKVFTPLGRPTCEELLLKPATISDGHQEKSGDRYGSDEKDVRSAAQERGGLELDLNLAMDPSEEEKQTSHENSVERRMTEKARSPTSRVRRTEVSRERCNTVCREYAGTRVVSASTTSSSHSFRSLQTRENSAQSVDGAVCHEAESRKTEREEVTMAILGCPSCLMYVMLCKVDPRCPKCGSSVLVDFPSSSNSAKRSRLA